MKRLVSLALTTAAFIIGGTPAFGAHQGTQPGSGSMSATFIDLCYQSLRADFTNTATDPQVIQIVRNNAPHGEKTLPAGPSYRVVEGLSDGDTVQFKAGGEVFATHVYKVHPACSKADKLDVTFADVCAGTTVTIIYFELPTWFWVRTSDGSEQSLQIVPGVPKSVTVTGATVNVIREMSEIPLVATHEWVKPSGCDTPASGSAGPAPGGNLPLTGAATFSLAIGGVVIVLLGAMVYFLARRRAPH